jgi:hypothetical protein
LEYCRARPGSRGAAQRTATGRRRSIGSGNRLDDSEEQIVEMRTFGAQISDAPMGRSADRAPRGVT